MNIRIEVETRSVYGNTLIYPVNDAAKAVARIAGTKTLSPIVIKNLRELGMEVVECFTATVTA
tara:strand:+ start:40883 stop:41071 length:189 start_codon:yes stop_codon:yes gene_type:complete